MPAPDSNPSPQRKPAATPATYADSGVDIVAGNRAKQRIKYLAQRTFTRNVLGEIGGFGGLFRLDGKYEEPVLVSSADGVGTKLKLAFQLGVHHTVGADLVNHCVNDIAVQGATPLFFLDYLATGRLDGEIAEKVVSGLSDACRANGCALIGGETAQMPGFYADGEYDLAGFIVGVVERSKLVTGAKIRAGDVLLGFPSTGLHTNGYSLARNLFFEVAKYKPDQYVNALKEKAGAALMKTHRSYLSLIKKLTASDYASGLAHITGGGFTDNIPRVLPQGMAVALHLERVPVLPVFKWLANSGKIAEHEMLRTFNCGIGMVAVVDAEFAAAASKLFTANGETVVRLGEVVAGSGDARVEYRGHLDLSR